MFEYTEIVISFATLTLLEVILGIDNLVFLTIISHRVSPHLQSKARKVGLTLAWLTRLVLLASAIALTKLTKPLLFIFHMGFSGRDIFLLAGGLFLLVKATQEIHAEMEPMEKSITKKKKYLSFSVAVTQIAILDIVFSLDSVLTAIGLTQHFWLMAAAITIAIITMLFASEPLSRFIEKHPTVKMLALSFLILIGMVLIADGLHYHISRAYIYFAMGFSLFVEMLNVIRSKRFKL